MGGWIRAYLQTVALLAASVTLGVSMLATSSAYASTITGSVNGLPPTLLQSSTTNDVVAGEREALMRGGVSAIQAEEAVSVQGAIDQTGLVGRLEAALGFQFAGVWFVSAQARLDVGFVSSASRSTIEALAGEAGLAGNVAAVRVRSTWAQLLKAQEHWNHRLTKLFADRQVETSLEPQHNGVIVTLGTSVPRAERTGLRSEAAAEDVNVLLASSTKPRLGIRLEGAPTCNKFKEDEAACSSTITAGVTIENADRTEKCTAGPVTMPTDESKETLETLLLTAGHCIEDGNGINEKWLALNKAFEWKEIGEAKTYVNELSADIGVIEVNHPGYWSAAAESPVFAGYAPWSALSPTALSVEGVLAKSVVGFGNCMEGQTTGQSCGKVKKLNVHLPEGTAGVVEDEMAKSAGGDSGGPWITGDPKAPVNFIEGTQVGKNLENGNPLFEPLETGLKELAKVRSVSLKLLTKANEVRKPCPMM